MSWVDCLKIAVSHTPALYRLHLSEHEILKSFICKLSRDIWSHLRYCLTCSVFEDWPHRRYSVVIGVVLGLTDLCFCLRGRLSGLHWRETCFFFVFYTSSVDFLTTFRSEITWTGEGGIGAWGCICRPVWFQSALTGMLDRSWSLNTKS